MLPFAHDVAVEGVEDALVRELQRVVQHDHAVGSLDLHRVTLLLRLAQLPLPHLHEALELVAPVAERAHCVHVERVLALADSRHPLLLAHHLRLLVRLPAVVCARTPSHTSNNIDMQHTYKSTLKACERRTCKSAFTIICDPPTYKSTFFV